MAVGPQLARVEEGGLGQVALLVQHEVAGLGWEVAWSPGAADFSWGHLPEMRVPHSRNLI